MQSLRRFFVLYFLYPFAVIQHKLNKKNKIPAKEFRGQVEPHSKSRLCVFSHFDKGNKIDDYVIYYLQKLADCDCEIIFVSH